MDIIANYPEFSNDIKEAFFLLIKEYDLIFFEVYEGCYELQNPNFSLRFPYDRGYVNCNIKAPQLENQFGYSIYSVLAYLFPETTLNQGNTLNEPRHQLFEYANTIGNKLKSAFKGNFSWMSGYLKEQENESKMIEFLWEELEASNPIFIKFKAGDVSWKKDLEGYLSKKGIVL
jgi:hypothetical protein